MKKYKNIAIFTKNYNQIMQMQQLIHSVTGEKPKICNLIEDAIDKEYQETMKQYIKLQEL